MRTEKQNRFKRLAITLAILGFASFVTACGEAPRQTQTGGTSFGATYSAGGCAPVTGNIGFSGQAVKGTNSIASNTPFYTGANGGSAASFPYNNISYKVGQGSMGYYNIGLSMSGAMAPNPAVCPSDISMPTSYTASSCYTGAVNVSGIIQRTSAVPVQTGYGNVCINRVEISMSIGSNNGAKTILYGGVAKLYALVNGQQALYDTVTFSY